MLSFDPERESTQDIYKLMTGVIVPRPIAFVSTVSGRGVQNLAPFSFFNAVCAAPPVVMFAAAVREADPPRGLSTHKDTLLNVIDTKEFVVNVVTEEIVERMNLTAAQVAPEVDEFALAGLTPVAGERVRAPRVAESPVQMECRLRQVVEISAAVHGSTLVLGDVLRFHIREDLVENFRVDSERLAAVGRMAGAGYARTRDCFTLERPR